MSEEIDRGEFLAAVPLAVDVAAVIPPIKEKQLELPLAQEVPANSKPRLLAQYLETEYPDGTVLDGVRISRRVQPGEKIDFVVRTKVESWADLDLLPDDGELAHLRSGSD